MFCPRCGVKNVDDAKFCRTCGADISLVPQALERRPHGSASDALEVEAQGEDKKERKKKRKVKEPPTLADGLETIFSGIALLIIFYITFIYYGGSFYIWGWLLIPALSCFGHGIGQIVSARREPRPLAPAAPFRTEPLPEQPRAAELAALDTSEIIPIGPPTSVTEETTRKLGAPAGKMMNAE